MIKEAIDLLTQFQNLSTGQAQEVFEEIFDHKATASQVASFLTALKMKGETEDEIFAAASVIRKKAQKLNIRENLLGMEIDDEIIMDTCGTGGSGSNKFNVSTTVSFVVSAAGIKVAKHGNRAMSSNCGSADVLEALDIKIDASSAVMEKAIKEIDIGFLFAPLYHPALKEVAVIRREMGIRTIFNIVGPLCSPVFPTHQLLGVYSPVLVLPMARVLQKLGVKKALVVYGKEVKDEVSLVGETTAAFVSGQKIKKIMLKPSDFGLNKISIKKIEVTNAAESAKIVKEVLSGKKTEARLMVLANASCCFYVSGRVNSFKKGAALAAQLIDEGKAYQKYLDFKNYLMK